MPLKFLRARFIAAVLVVLAVLSCLAYAAYRTELSPWWRAHGGGIPYVLFWIFLLHFFWPNPKLLFRICAAVVLVTTGLEFLQLWNPEPLATIRETRFGVALLGNTFVWMDIPPYFIGGGIGYLVLWVCTSIRRSQASATDL